MKALELEKSLKEYKDAETDIEILERENEKLCEDNNAEIRKLEVVRSTIKIDLEADLKKSKLKKLECKFGNYIGAIGFKDQPNEWIYVDDVLMDWIISLPEKLKELYLKVTTTVKKGDLKKQIIADNDWLFENSKIIEERFNTDIGEIFIQIEEKEYKVKGIEIKPQVPKFSINIKKKK